MRYVEKYTDKHGREREITTTIDEVSTEEALRQLLQRPPPGVVEMPGSLAVRLVTAFRVTWWMVRSRITRLWRKLWP
jgi:hypothetical protein